MAAGLAGFAVGLAVFALVVVLSVTGGFRKELISRTLGLDAHVVVAGAGLDRADRADRAALVKRLEEISGVTTVTPGTRDESILQARGLATAVLVRGLRPGDLETLPYIERSLTQAERAAFGRAGGGDGVLIGKSLAREAGLRTGDSVALHALGGGGAGAPQMETFEIDGVFESGVTDFDRTVVLMPLDQARRFFAGAGAWDFLAISLADPEAVDRLEGAIREAAGPQAGVEPWTERMALFRSALEVQRIAMSLIFGLVVAIAALNIISGIVMLVKNKTRDIAILRTVGASQGSMLRVFFIAGAAIGVAGALTGLILGLLYCLNIGAIQHFLEGLFQVRLFDADVYMLEAIPAEVDPLDVVWVTLWSFFMSCVAGLIPSWQAAKLDPVEALRRT